MPPTKANSTLLNDLYLFIKGAEDVPYEQLGKHATDAGWIWRLRQTAVEPTAFGSLLVNFVLLIGKADDPGHMEAFDELTIQVPVNGMSAPTLFARIGADPTILHAVFGRIHPTMLVRIAEAAAQRPNAQPNGVIHDASPPAEQTVDMSRGDAELAAPVEVIKGRLRNGAPLFEDLFALDGAKESIIDAVLDAFVDYLPNATTAEDVVAVYVQNPTVKEFFNDLGTEEDRAELKKLLEDRTAALRPVEDTPRRRRAAAVN